MKAGFLLYNMMMSIIIDQSIHKRLQHLRAVRGDADLRLRVRVDGGGCSGFQYKFSLDSKQNADDQIFENLIVTDVVSLPLLNGATFLYEETLTGSEFKINNPNAISGCGCGASFAV